MHPEQEARLFAAFITPSENLLNRGAPGMFAQLLDPGHCSQGVLTFAISVGLEIGDGFAVTRNHNRFPTLNVVEKFGKLRFCLRSLYLLHLL